MRMAFLVSVGIIGFVTSSVRAECLPTFWPAGCSYRATHIVVVTVEPAGGGRFKVTESWKGDLKPGDALTIPGLARDAKGDMALFMARDPDPKSAQRGWWWEQRFSSAAVEGGVATFGRRTGTEHYCLSFSTRDEQMEQN